MHTNTEFVAAPLHWTSPDAAVGLYVERGGLARHLLASGAPERVIAQIGDYLG